jgi:DNA-binding transcriptional LysR family regulator
MTGIDLRQLEYFVRIARLGGFRRAAEDLSVSQASISQQMKLLEAELRVPLFERAHRPVSLTEAGTIVLERAELILQELKSTREDVHAFAGLERGHVRVGTLPAHGAGWTVRMLGEFHRRYPLVELDLVEHNSAILLDLLLDRAIDVACMNIPGDGWDAPKGVCLAHIFGFELGFVVNSGHRFRNLKRVPLEEVVDEPLIMPPHSSLSWIIDQAFRARGLTPSVRFHITDQHTLLELAAEGIGVGVSTRFAVAQRPELSLHVVHAADAQLTGIGVAAWTERGIRNKAVQALVNHARAWAATANWPSQT